MKHIFLIGFMGCGKSTIARKLSTQLGLPQVEMDEQIVKEQGMPITEILEKKIDAASSVVLGPGLGQSEMAEKMVRAVLEICSRKKKTNQNV